MGKVRRSTLFGLTFLLLFVAGCKVSCTTANVSSLTLSKDKEGNVQTKEFARNDTVYARANVSNNGSTVTLKFRLVGEKIEGQKENIPIPGTEFSIDVPGNGYAVYHAQLGEGFPPGRYRIEVAMLYNGEQKDQKTDTFTVTGGSTGGTTPSPAVTKSPPGSKPPVEPAEDDKDDTDNSNAHGEH